MATTRIVLVRHGHRDGPDPDRGLSPQGRAQARALGERLATEGLVTRPERPERPKRPESPEPPAVYSSTLPRAIETARIATGLDPVQDCGLCSWHLPDGPLRPSAHGGVFLPFEQDNESWSDVVGRLGKTVSRIAVRHAGGTVLIFTHEQAVHASFIVLGALPLFRTFDLTVDFASLTEWDTDDDPAAEWDTAASRWLPVRWRLVRFNDAAHTAALPPP